MADQVITRQVDDTLIPIASTLTQADGTVVDLSGMTVNFTLVLPDGTVKLAATAATITDATNGEVQYDLQAADVDTAGTYWAYFIAIDGGESNTYPVEQGALRIVFVEPGSAEINIELTATWDTLRADVGHFLGYSRGDGEWTPDEEETLSAVIKAGLLRVYYPNSATPGVAFQWSWMRPSATIDTVAPYSTGTVTIASGVVTLSDGTFVTTLAWAAYGELTVDGETYTVDTYDSTTQLTLDDTSVTVADASVFSLARVVYELPSTFGGSFDGELVYKPGSEILYRPVKIISNALLRRWRQNNVAVDRPRYAAVRPVAFVPATGQRWEIEFYPAPSGAYELHGRYKIAPTMLDSVNKYPPGGIAMSGVYAESCLAIAEQRLHDEAGIHTEQFKISLQTAMANDADVHAPHTLGYNADNSDRRHGGHFDEHDGVAVHSFDGIVYRD